jgi:hypothetical protein
MNIEVDPHITYLLTLGMDIEKNPGPTPSDEYLRLCNMNIRSLNAKSNYPGGLPRYVVFKNAVMGNCDIITLTETWLTSEHLDNSYRLPG